MLNPLVRENCQAVHVLQEDLQQNFYDINIKVGKSTQQYHARSLTQPHFDMFWFESFMV